MTTNERAARVLQEIDAALEMAEKATPGPWSVADAGEVGVYCSYRLLTMTGGEAIRNQSNAAFIAASRTGWPKTLRGLKTAIDGLLACRTNAAEPWLDGDVKRLLTELCDQWEAK